ncbi:FAD-linked oxidase C-terminal domain-containing protein [Kiritimatiellota bacterium B12222]|nr:FAD-linked oxidase C-terminal domain-containing protein [Kiritimatiellota bacterium B12222]
MSFLSDLSKCFAGEIDDSEVIRGIHATDASHYQIMPLAVACPQNEADVIAAMKCCHQHHIPITPRGAATSLSGQTHGPGLVLDLTRHMDQCLEIDEQKGLAKVQPGLIRDQLNLLAGKKGLQFAPDPATSSRATIGGMVGNNSSGTRSIIYGITSDHVLGCRLVLANGDVLEFTPRLLKDWEKDPANKYFKGLRNLVDLHRTEIEKRFPKVMRRVSGYALDAFLEDPKTTPWNLARLVCGSEGSLGVITELTLNLEPLPRSTAVVAVHYAHLMDALRNVEPMLEQGPSAIELLDETVLREAQRNPSTRDIADFIEGQPGAMLLVEFMGENEADTAQKAQAMIETLKKEGIATAMPFFDSDESQQKAWDVRRLGLGLITNVKGATKGQAVIEDACIPLPHLPDYIAEVMEKCRQEDVNLILYAHASVGVLHARPELDLHKDEDIAKMRRIADYAFSRCVFYGGAWAGEHGDGMVRGEFIPKFFGPQIYQAFKEVKNLFDPENLMNPGKLIDAAPLTSHLRYQVPGYAENAATQEKKAWFHYREQGGLTLAVEQCNGVGACRKIGSGVMCPSFMATRNEKDSTRARANALRLAISGQLYDGDTQQAIASDKMQEIMGLCLGCKACKKECPNAVDMAKMKAEVLQTRYEQHGTPLGARIVGDLPGMAGYLTGPAAPAINWVNNLPPMRKALEKIAGIDTRRPLPAFVKRSLKSQLGDALHLGSGEKGNVALYIDSYTNAYEPHVGLAALNLLSACGYQVIPLFVGDSQRARISKGLLKLAKRDGEKVLRQILIQAPGDMPVLCLEPSCASSLKDDLPDLINDEELGKAVSDRVWMIDEFLYQQKAPLRPKYGKMLIHGHCHQKSVFGIEGLRRLLPQAKVIDAGCCGMAGAFGYEHRDLSLKIGEERLFPAIRAREPGTEIVANGFSCRHQVHEACGIMPKHFVEVVEYGFPA